MTSVPGRLTFPEGFVWGVATAAHQIEGGNVNNDWWEWEHNPESGTLAPSGDACDSFHRWREDVNLVAEWGLSAYRFSLEWSRIEPEEGEFSIAALEHYRRICAACHGQGITPVVTFHHFTTPRWLTARGGWESPDAAECFARFVTRATAYLGDLIGWACTINEPNVVGVMGYFQGQYPPGVKDDFFRFSRRQRFDDQGASPGGGGAAFGTRPIPGGADPVHGRNRGRARRRGVGRRRPKKRWRTSSCGPPVTTTSSGSSATPACISVPKAWPTTTPTCR